MGDPDHLLASARQLVCDCLAPFGHVPSEPEIDAAAQKIVLAVRQIRLKSKSLSQEGKEKT